MYWNAFSIPAITESRFSKHRDLPGTLEEVTMLFKAHVTPTEQGCMRLLSVPFSPTLHHINMGFEHDHCPCLTCSVNTLEQTAGGVTHRLLAICFTKVSSWERQALLRTSVGLSSAPILKAILQAILHNSWESRNYVALSTNMCVNYQVTSFYHNSSWNMQSSPSV